MNEEITKILTYLNNQNWYVFEDDYNEPEINHKILEEEEVKILLDYITNLQQENQQLKERLNHHNEIVEYSYDLMLQKDKYKQVLDEIREQLKFERKIALSLNKPYTVSVIDKLLDKVKE